MNKRQRIYVAGHRGMVGSAIVRQLKATTNAQIITRTHAELDLTDQRAVQQFFSAEEVDQVYLAAAKVGGIHANNAYPAEFIYQNLMMEANVIHHAWLAGVKRLLFLGSSCIYPKHAQQPMIEDVLLTGPLEPTNEPYAIAKIAGIKLCESYNRQYDTDYRCVMPTNLYGPGDNYHPENSHVIPALIRRIHEAKTNGDLTVEIWGTGTPRREFLYADDMANASVHVMDLPRETYKEVCGLSNAHVNIGVGWDISIYELATRIANVIGFSGEIRTSPERPDGAPRKLLDITRLARTGWQPNTDFDIGIAASYSDFLSGNFRI